MSLPFSVVEDALECKTGGSSFEAPIPRGSRQSFRSAFLGVFSFLFNAWTGTYREALFKFQLRSTVVRKSDESVLSEFLLEETFETEKKVQLCS